MFIDKASFFIKNYIQDGYRVAFNATRRRLLSPFLASSWFLASGEWDTAGFWRDGIPWNQDWFLASGTWYYLGVWDDAEAW
jgi:hypothetical protein